MTISNILYINLKKLRVQFKKGLFLIIPIIFLVTTSVVATSQITNIENALDSVLFGTIEDQSTVLKIEREQDEATTGGFGRRGAVAEPFNESDIIVLEDIEGVEQAEIISSLPINGAQTEELFDGITYSIGRISPLSESIAGVYTNDDFTYTEGEPIPIILNASTFQEVYEDWGGETTFSIDLRSLRQSGADPQTIRESAPIKTRAIETDIQELLGTEFNLQVGGLPDIETFENTNERGLITITQRTAEEVQEKETLRSQEIGLYWDYDLLSAGTEYTFIVAGVIEEEGNNNTFVPVDFANVLMEDYFQLQLDARNDQSIDDAYVNTVFTGLSYADGQLTGANNGAALVAGISGGQGRGGPGAATEEEAEVLLSGETYSIPGLVYEDVDGLLFEYTALDAYQESLKSGQQVFIKAVDFDARQSVIDGLNADGYAFQDFGDLDDISSLRSNLRSILYTLFVGFVVVTALVVLITMLKFVGDARKEIGIYRAIGATKNTIMTMFIIQSLLYVSLSYVIGLVVGLLGNVLAQGLVTSWFDENVTQVLNNTYNISETTDMSLFTAIDWQSIGLFTVVLVMVSVLAALYPAMKASKVSPVEAIKSE